MANPNIPQGNLNRIKASVVYTNYPALNVTASYLLPEGLDLTLEGSTTGIIPSMTGLITSPEPYQIARVTLHISKTQGLASQYKAQMELNSVLGDFTIYPDATTLPTYYINNGSITALSAMSFSGRTAGFLIQLTGSYNTNSNLWN
jgi:hypothetical protein